MQMPCSADKNTTTFLKKNPESVLKAMSLSNNIVEAHWWSGRQYCKNSLQHFAKNSLACYWTNQFCPTMNLCSWLMYNSSLMNGETLYQDLKPAHTMETNIKGYTLYFTHHGGIFEAERNTKSCMCNRQCCIYGLAVPSFHHISQTSSLERYHHSQHHPSTTFSCQKHHSTSKHFSDHHNYSCEQNQCSSVEFVTFQTVAFWKQRRIWGSYCTHSCDGFLKETVLLAFSHSLTLSLNSYSQWICC